MCEPEGGTMKKMVKEVQGGAALGGGAGTVRFFQ